MSEFKLIAEVEVRPTEDEEKVEQALRNILMEVSIEKVQKGDKTYIVAKSDKPESLLTIHAKLRESAILEAARSYLKKFSSDSKVIMYLNKQAAFVGRISFCIPERESSLGPIKVEVECNDPESLIDWLAPHTRRGHPVREYSLDWLKKSLKSQKQ